MRLSRVGAHSLAAHGAPRATGDLDVLVRPTPANAERVFRALVHFGAPVGAHQVTATDFATPGTVDDRRETELYEGDPPLSPAVAPLSLPS